MRLSATPLRLFFLLALAVVLAPGALAQSLDAPTFDPLTGEPVPFGFEAPPAEASAAARGGGDLTPVEYLPSGSAKLVRSLGPDVALFQDGGSLVTVALDDETPIVLDRFVLPAQPSDGVVADGMAYVPLRKNRGLLILDVSDPANVTEVGRLEGRDLLSIAVEGDYAYAGQGSAGIVVYDVSDPSAPVEVATQASAGSSNGTFVDGSTLYVAAGNAGLRTFDITDPTAPAALGSLGTSDTFCTYVTVRDGVAWLTGGFGLIAADISDPAAPTQIGSFGTGGETTYEIAFIDDTTFLPGLDGLRTLDVSDPAAIMELALVPGSQFLSTDSEPGTATAYYAERFTGIYELDVTDPADPVQESEVRTAGFAHKMAFVGDLLYVTDLAGGLRILDTSGEETVELSRLDVPPNTQFVALEGDFAYVADADFGGTGLTIIDVSDPADPQIVGSFASANQAFGLDVVTDGEDVTVYLANGFSGIVVLDASDPANVTELGGFPFGANAFDVAVRDGVAYVASFGGGMLTLDVSNPANITQLDAEPTFGFLNAIDLDASAINNSYAYLADGQNGLRVVDISDPADIVSLDTYPTLSQARDVAATSQQLSDAGEYKLIYIADDFFGLREFMGGALDFDETGSFESGDRGIGVATNRTGTDLDEALVALAAGEAGVYLFELPPNILVANEDGTTAEAFMLQSAFPNPFRAATTVRFTLPDAADVTLAVYDVLGRRVATLEDGTLAAGDHEATFDAAGLPSGVYLVRLDAGSRHATERVVHVR